MARKDRDKELELKEKAIGIKVNGGAGFIRFLPTLLVSAGVLALNAFGIGASWGGWFGGQQLGNLFETVPYGIWNTFALTANIFAFGGFVLPAGISAINAIRTHHLYKKQMKFAYDENLERDNSKFQESVDVHNKLKVDFALQKNEALIDSVITPTIGESESRLEKAVADRAKCEKAPWIKKWFLHEKCIRNEDYVRKVIADRMDRLNELCVMKHKDWKDKKGRPLTDEEIKTRIEEMGEIQLFLANVVNKSEKSDPYLKTIISKTKEHKKTIELVTDLNNNFTTEKKNVATAITSEIRRGEAKKAVYLTYGDAKKTINSGSGLTPTSLFESYELSNRYKDARDILNRLNDLDSQAESSVASAENATASILDLHNTATENSDKIKSLLGESVEDNKEIKKIAGNAKNMKKTQSLIEALSSRIQVVEDNLKPIEDEIKYLKKHGADKNSVKVLKDKVNDLKLVIAAILASDTSSSVKILEDRLNSVEETLKTLEKTTNTEIKRDLNEIKPVLEKIAADYIKMQENEAWDSKKIKELQKQLSYVIPILADVDETDTIKQLKEKLLQMEEILEEKMSKPVPTSNPSKQFVEKITLVVAWAHLNNKPLPQTTDDVNAYFEQAQKAFKKSIKNVGGTGSVSYSQNSKVMRTVLEVVSSSKLEKAEKDRLRNMVTGNKNNMNEDDVSEFARLLFEACKSAESTSESTTDDGTTK